MTQDKYRIRTIFIIRIINQEYREQIFKYE